MTAAPRYLELIEEAARLHLAALGSLLERGVSPDTRRAVTALIETTELALARGTTLDAQDVPFSAELLRPRPPVPQRLAPRAVVEVGQPHLEMRVEGAGLGQRRARLAGPPRTEFECPAAW